MKVRVPADVDMADRVLAGLTARQCLILGAHALSLWGLWLAIGRFVPAFVFGAVAVPIATVGFVWATVKVEGTSLERLAAAALAHVRSPRRRVVAPEGMPPVPSWSGQTAVAVGTLELPMDVPDEQGLVRLGSDGYAAICRASSINFALRSEEEQRALVDAFGRLLNSLDAPVQILIRSDRVNLDATVREMRHQSSKLAHPALEEAASEHAEFLQSLGARRDVLARQALVCFCDPIAGDPEDSVARLAPRVEEAATLLCGLGIRLVRLDDEHAARVLARASNPESRNGSEATYTSPIVKGKP